MRRFILVLVVIGLPAINCRAQLFLPGNLVVNPAFENNPSGWINYGAIAVPPTQELDGLQMSGVIYQGQAMQQAISTTIGDRYEIQFSLLAGNGLIGDPTPGNSLVNVYWGGSQGLNLGQCSNPSTTTWETFNLFATATSSSTTLEFFDPVDPHLQLIDAVSVAAVPEPPISLLLSIGLGLIFFCQIWRFGVRSNRPYKCLVVRLTPRHEVIQIADRFAAAAPGTAETGMAWSKVAKHPWCSTASANR